MNNKVFKNIVFRNFSSLLMGNILMQLLNFISVLYVAKMVCPDDFGLFSFMIIQSQLIAAVSDLGIRNVVIRKLVRNLSFKNQLLFPLLLIAVFSNFALLLLYSGYNSIFGSLSIIQIGLIVLMSVLISISNIFESYFFAFQKMIFPSVAGVLNSLLWISIILLLTEKGVNGEQLFLFNLIILIVKPLVLIIASVRQFALRLIIVDLWTTIIELIKEAFPFFLLILIALPANYLANNFLEINSSIEQVGFFALGTKFTLPISMVLNVLLVALFPNLSAMWSENRDKFNRLITKGIPLFVLFGAVGAFVLTLLLPLIFEKFIDPAYSSSIIICKIQVWYVVLMGICSLIGTIWGTMNKEVLSLKMAIINSIINTPLLWIGSKYGAMGLSIAYVVSFSLFMLILWTVFLKTNKISYKISLIWLLFILLGSLSILI